MLDRAHRCGLAATERADPMLGTAFPASRVLLVEQPGGWGVGGLASSQFDPAVAGRLINTLGRQGVRVLAVRRPGRQSSGDLRAWGFADSRPNAAGIVWGSYRRPDELLDLDPAELAGRPADRRPVYAVCAHGTRDMCCAIEGRPVAAALDRLCPGRAWECSHVGGDRFAANVLVLPSGQLYGRVTDPAELVRETEAGRLLPGLLRGQIGQPAPVQAALAYAHAELGLPELGSLRPIEPIELTGTNPQLVRLGWADGSCTVAVRREVGEPAMLTCRGAAAKYPLSYRPLWLRID